MQLRPGPWSRSQPLAANTAAVSTVCSHCIAEGLCSEAQAGSHRLAFLLFLQQAEDPSSLLPSPSQA